MVRKDGTRFYDPDELLGLLLAAGFQQAQCLDAAADVGVCGAVRRRLRSLHCTGAGE
jgi:hypothetical protein